MRVINTHISPQVQNRLETKGYIITLVLLDEGFKRCELKCTGKLLLHHMIATVHVTYRCIVQCRTIPHVLANKNSLQIEVKRIPRSPTILSGL